MEATLKQVMTVMVQFVVASIRSLIGRENSRHPLNQSYAKLTIMATCRFGIDLFGFSLQSSIEARFIGFSLLASGFPRCEHAPLTNQQLNVVVKISISENLHGSSNVYFAIFSF